ncbi:MAG: hypothetical protein COT89_02455 [Candidatus Colwellbacteria bacterium CG10_big_fil_rev_8_21_14_0_10_42_22]|uniref:Uncharacterized protein n=1 Tax=Candidatus Colwellbacteria bacterium CG10_big_fil_rev_8_21_14_0_10_42_22 TaxID=1974540 RepID=A0A2H0VHS8_9BACT|nr:MAG: hypothetical protein COT89_02455 [Candidatus Colwellbacteria bacterium CG10_big_fil_rev_8_21_14_0_10_42_22]
MKLKEFQKLENEDKLEEIFKSVEKTRKYFKVTLIVALVVIVLPLLVLPMIIGQFLNTYNLNVLGL